MDIRLARPLRIEAFTIEHVPSAIAYNTSSAPLGVSLRGMGPPPCHWLDVLCKVKQRNSRASLLGGGDPGEVSGVVSYGTFDAVAEGAPGLQTFKAHPDSRAWTHARLTIHSNHGNPEYTCLYRVRVHGTPVVPDGTATRS